MATEKNNYKQEAINLMELIVKNSLGLSNKDQSDPYYTTRELIKTVFKDTSGLKYNKTGIILRLTVIDSLYSTNAKFNYFSIDNMADKILKIGKTEADVCNFFYDVVQLNYCTGSNDNPAYKFFNEYYGIHKNLDKGDQNLSLLTKYAYYSLLQDTHKYPLGFPIYDNLVKKHVEL